MIEVLAGAALGIAGSVHCLAMCGPLVLAVGRANGPHRLRHALLYHGGRVLLYMLLGTAAGLLGSTFALAGLGRGVSIAAGVILIAGALAHQRWLRARSGGRWSSSIARWLASAHRWGKGRPVTGPVLTGALNGLLPCGLTYAAVTAAVALGSPAAAAAFMAGFGIATAPALLALVFTAAAVPPQLRLRLRRLAPAALVILGALLIARGLMPPAHAPQSGVATATHAH